MMIISGKIKQASPVYIDPQLLHQYFDFLNLPKDHRIGFANQPCVSKRCKKFQGEHMHIRVTTPETAYRLHNPLWRRVNIVENPRKRETTRGVRVYLNMSFDIDWRDDSNIAIEVTLIFLQKLVDELAIHPDTPIILSGRGTHIIINIPPIDIDEDNAELFNIAVSNVVKEKFLPHFEYAKSIVEVTSLVDLSSMKLEGYDIDRLMSAPGDINPHTNEIRSVYQNKPLIRRESKPVRSYILEEYYKLQKDIFERDNFTQEFSPIEEIAYKEIFVAHAHHNDVFEAVTATLDWYIKEKEKNNALPLREDGEIDRSILFGKLVWYIAGRCRSGSAPYHFRHIIHAFCQNKYGSSDERLEYEIGRCLRKWTGPKGFSPEERKQIVKETKQPKKIKETSDEMFLVQFVMKICERDTTSSVTKESFIEKYNKYCKNQKRIPMSDQRVTRQLQQINIKSDRITVQNKKIRIYSGIKIKDFATE